MYRGILTIRRKLYQLGILKSGHPGVPVIVVGNITVGGTGKSPVTVALAKHLVQRGLKPGIVSRGYGGVEIDGARCVEGSMSASEVGDEAVMMARMLPALPVVVDKDRLRGARYLAQLGCDCVLADDGLQHLRLRRDVELAVVDGGRGFGNKHLLPAGPLREPISRLESVTAILANLGHGEQEVQLAELGHYGPPVHGFTLQPLRLRHHPSGRLKPLSDLEGQSVLAVAGIGNPQRFFDTLQSLGAKLHGVPRKDHDPNPFRDLPAFTFDLLVTTAKDAVKWRTGDPEIWVLEVEALLPEDLTETVMDVILQKRS
jgi:tetraacyldisaccharide 4'-kinase